MSILQDSYVNFVPQAKRDYLRLQQTPLSLSKVIKLSVMTRSEKFTYFFMIGSGMVLTSTFGIWWFEPFHVPHNFSGTLHIVDIVLFLLLSYVVWYQLVNEIFAWTTVHFMKKPLYLPPEKNKRVAFLTAFVPNNEPYDVLVTTLRAMLQADYPHDVWLLDEGDDSVARKICAKLGVHHYTRKNKPHYNMIHGPYRAKTKAGNYNSWYDQYAHLYDFVAQVDVDFVPRKNFLTQTLGYFRDRDVAFVGSPQIYGNIKDSWIAEGAAQQAYNFYGSMQKGFFGNDMALFIGANHVVRVDAHNTIDGYSGHIVEDHLTGMKFYKNNWKSVYVAEILAVGEGPSTWDSYFSQQMRWAYGLIHILFTQSPKLFLTMKPVHIVNYFLLQQYYFYGLSQCIGIFLLTVYFLYGIQSTAMDLLQLLLLYPTLLIFQQIFFLWVQRFNIDPQNESGFMIKAKLLNFAAWPIYFLAFCGVLMRKKLTYKVTPKGSKQYVQGSIAYFLPHTIFGTITLVDIIVGFLITHHQAPQLAFWAIINTLVMYGFVAHVIFEKFIAKSAFSLQVTVKPIGIFVKNIKIRLAYLLLEYFKWKFFNQLSTNSMITHRKNTDFTNQKAWDTP